MLINISMDPNELDLKLNSTDKKLNIKRKKQVQLFFENILSIYRRGIHRLYVKPKLMRWAIEKFGTAR